MIPFQTIDWSLVQLEEVAGEKGKAVSQTLQFQGLRIRKVQYSSGYVADHWCQKGHIVHCLEGSFVTEMKTGEKHVLSKGMTFVVSDDMSSHRSVAENDATLLIIDGEFLEIQPE